MKRVKMVFYCVSVNLLLMYSIGQLGYYYDKITSNANLEVVKYNQDTIDTKEIRSTYIVSEAITNEYNKLLEEAKRREEEKHRKWINIVASAYTSSADECGGKSDGVTASGAIVQANHTIATPSDIPFQTKICIPELGTTFVAEDRGNPQYIGRIDGDTIRIDIYMRTKEEAINFGVRKYRGYIIID